MAASTSEQVRLILEAAERGAAELRATAGTEAAGHVARVQAATNGMLDKLDHPRIRAHPPARGPCAPRASASTEGLSALHADVAQGIPPTPAQAAA